MSLYDKDTPALSEENSHCISDKKRSGLFFQGKEIILGRKPGRPFKYVHNPENGWWSQTKKIEVCTLYTACGSVKRTSELTGCPENVIRGWKTEDWWYDIVGQITKENHEYITTHFTKILGTALEKLAVLVENGNHIYSPKKDEWLDVPLSASELIKVAATFTDKRQLIQGKPTSRTERVTADDRLNKLAEQFKRFASAKEIDNAEEIGKEVEEAGEE